MKKFTLLLFALVAAASLSAQDCSSAADCLAKGQATNFESEAFKFYEKGIKLAKKENYNPSTLYFERGVKYYKMYTPNYKDAEKDFKASIKADEKNFWPHMWLAEVYAYGDKDKDKSIAYLTSVLEKFPNDPRVFRERANINYYYNNIPMALADYEMAYNLMIDDHSQIDTWTIGSLTTWYAELYMRQNNLALANDFIVGILEGGAKIAPDNAKLLGELALAYHDVGKKDLAFEYGKKAHDIDKDNVGSLFVAITAFDNKDYREASSLMWMVDKVAMHPHPLVYYYFSNVQWSYCFNVAKNMWANYQAAIKDRFERAARFKKGNAYDWYIDESARLRATLN